MIRDLLKRLYDKIVFLAGDIHSVPRFPWISFGVKKHKINFDEVLMALELAEPGDIGLHRDEGFLSNLVIPGYLKHGWIHVSDGFFPKIVEAVSEGVIMRSAIYPLCSDYAIIVRPLDMSDKDVDNAVMKARTIVGENYDTNFDFDIEAAIKHFTADSVVSDGSSIGLSKFDPAFSCTEVCAFSWWHKALVLGLRRRKLRGKQVIMADDFLNPDAFKIIWISKSITVEGAQAAGLQSKGVRMISDFIYRRDQSEWAELID